MFELINEFQNYDIIKKRKEKPNKNDQFFFYLGDKDSFPQNLYNEPDIFTVIKYDNYQAIISNLDKYYHNNKSIHDQFELDIKRSYLYINGNKSKDIVKINNYIEYSYPKKKNELEIICTQSIFAPLLEWFYMSIPDGYFIGELGNNEKRTKAKIYLDNNNIQIIKKLRIFTITPDGNDKTYRYIKIKISVLNYLITKTIDYELKFSHIFI